MMSYNTTDQTSRGFNDDSNLTSGGVQGVDDDGGSGFGQAGGYTGSQGREQGQDTVNSYGETDPGMAGNRGYQDTQNIPGVGQTGGQQDTGSYGETVGGQGRSRGYERDNDEYDDEYDTAQGQGAGTGRAPKASLSSKVMGGMEKMAGKVAGKPGLETKGEQRQSPY